MSTVALGTPDSNRDTSGVGSVPSTPSLTIVSSPRVGTLIPNRVFVGGFPPTTFEHELKVFFEKFGAVKEVKIIRDPSGTSKGYGFITYDTDEEAKKIQEMTEPLEFKGRHLNIGPAIRKTSSHFKTYDIVPQGAVLCSYGVPYALQNGITLVAATPETYAVAQPSQTTTLPYSIVMQQPMQPFLYPSLPLAAAAQSPTTPTVAIAGQHQTANQAATSQPCIAQHIQQNHATPTSPSKMGTLTYMYDGGADEHVQKAAPPPQPVAAAAFQPNLAVSVVPNIGNLALNGVTTQQAPQYRLATGNVASPMTQYIYPNAAAAAAGYANMLQDIAPYTTANAYIHHPEYAELYPNSYDNYSEGRNNRYSPRKQATQQQQQQQSQQYATAAAISHASSVAANGGRYASSSAQKNGRYAAKAVNSPGCHKMVTCGNYEFDVSKTDTKQPPGSVVTPPPTPIATESKG